MMHLNALGDPLDFSFSSMRLTFVGGFFQKNVSTTVGLFVMNNLVRYS